MSKSIVFDKSKDFAVRIMRMSRYLREGQKEWVISQQIGRSGTSIGANISEALHSISYKEYVAKMYLSLKECRETLYWLELLANTGYITAQQYDSMHADCYELFKMLSAITLTAKNDLKTTHNSSLRPTAATNSTLRA